MTSPRPLATIRFIPAHPDNPAEQMAAALINTGAINGSAYTDALLAQGFTDAAIARHIDEAVAIAYRLVKPECRPGLSLKPSPDYPPLVAALRLALQQIDLSAAAAHDWATTQTAQDRFWS